MIKKIAIFLFLFPSVFSSFSWASIELIGVGNVSGETKDKSGLTDLLQDGTPQDRLGAFGSGIAYTGRGKRYVCVADRGPADGKTGYRSRFHEFDISVKEGGVDASLIRTQLLSDETGAAYTGRSSFFNYSKPRKHLRLDPEGVRVGYADTIVISDEYGPTLCEFDRKTGRRIHAWNVPDKFLVEKPAASAEEELPPHNQSGRQPNRGLEGLAITPNGLKLFAILQSPLIQDHALDGQHKRIGLDVRITELSLTNGNAWEFLYQLESPDNGVSEMLAVNDHEFLVLERDGKSGSAAVFKKIFKIDVAKATDISKIDTLPETGIPDGVIAADKHLFIDLLEPAYGLTGSDFPEKVEGLAFGPDLKDGRHLLLVTTDNDFRSDRSTRIYAFAIDRKELPGFRPQEFRHQKMLVFILLGLLALLWGFLLRWGKIKKMPSPGIAFGKW